MGGADSTPLVSVVPAIGLLLAAWSLGAGLLLGLGLLVTRDTAGGADGMFAAFWSGLVAALGALQVWHLAWPVGDAALALLGSLAAAGLVHGRRRLWSGRPRLRRPWTGALVLAALVFVADRSLGPPRNDDSGGYHLPSVRWAVEQPLVPGLANLQQRFGFDSSFFPFVALCDAGPFTLRSHHVASGLLLAALLAQCLVQGARAWRADPRASDVAALLLVPAVLGQALGPNASSPSPDLAVFVLGAVVGLRILALCETRSGSGVPVVALAAALATVKLSAASFAAAASLVAGLVVPRDRRSHASMIAVAALLLLPSAARHVVRSGYPAYPVPALGVPVEWRVPEEDVVRVSEWVRSWARAPGRLPEDVLGRFDWLGPWWASVRDNRVDVLAPLALGTLGVAGLAVAWRHRERRRVVASLSPVLCPVLASLAFWFATAPAVRFLGAALWLWAALSTAIAATALGERAGRGAAALAVMLAVGVLAGAARRGDLLVEPVGPDGFHATPEPALGTFITRSGLVLLVPRDRDCYQAPLPCTPEPRAELRLRRPGDLASGFVRDP